jgi:hypothetical protein
VGRQALVARRNPHIEELRQLGQFAGRRSPILRIRAACRSGRRTRRTVARLFASSQKHGKQNQTGSRSQRKSHRQRPLVSIITSG